MNVIDSLKDKTNEEIRSYCYQNSLPASVAMFNTEYDFNIGQIIRNSNFLGFREVFHIQKEGRRMDRRGAVGSYHYTKVEHHFNADTFF